MNSNQTLQTRWLLVLFAACFSLNLESTFAAGPQIYRVDPSKRPGGDGRSWARAFHDLREALEVAQTGDQIWLKKGVHRLSEGHFYNRDITQAVVPYPLEFFSDQGIVIRGGFDGFENSIEERLGYDASDTILDGDVLGNDRGKPLSDPLDNTPTVLKLRLGGGKNATIEGITVQGAFDDTNPASTGAVDIHGNSTSSILMENCLIHFNAKGEDSGGFHSRNVRVTIRDSVFEHNEGSGLNLLRNQGLAVRVISRENTTGMFLRGNQADSESFSLQDCDFEDNTEEGLFVDDYEINAEGCSFSSNERRGLYAFGRSIINLDGCDFLGNQTIGAEINPGNFSIANTATGEIADCLFQENVTGGLEIQNGAITINASQFVRNGNAIFILASSLKGQANLIQENQGSGATNGIEVAGDSDLTFANSFFFGNRVAISIPSLSGVCTLFNPVFVGNSNPTSRGGAIRNSGELNVYNGTFVANSAVGTGDAIAQDTFVGATPVTKLVHCVFFKNTASGGDPIALPLSPDSDSNSIGVNPKFYRLPDPGDQDWLTFSDNDYGDLHLLGSSPVIDQGNILNLPSDVLDIDRDGNSFERLPLDVTYTAARTRGSAPDLGAYENVSSFSQARSGSSRNQNAWTETYFEYWVQEFAEKK